MSNDKLRDLHTILCEKLLEIGVKVRCLDNFSTLCGTSCPLSSKKNELNLGVISIDIDEGDLLLFPGYLPHKVAKNESGQDRIVISFNVGIK